MISCRGAAKTYVVRERAGLLGRNADEGLRPLGRVALRRCLEHGGTVASGP